MLVRSDRPPWRAPTPSGSEVSVNPPPKWCGSAVAFGCPPTCSKKSRIGPSSSEGLEVDDPDDSDPGYTFYKAGNAVHTHWDNTVLGHVTLEANGLRLQANSVERADRLRALLESGCEGRLRHRAREHVDPSSNAIRGFDSTLPASPPPPEAREAILEFKARHYAAWLDAPLPALGGKTPRRAARTRRGREQVDLLLRSMENAERRDASRAPFDFGRLRRELGLDLEQGDLARA